MHSSIIITHISCFNTHNFSLMRMIFIFMSVSLLLDADAKFRNRLIVLPFICVLIDIAAMWLKRYVSPIFF